MNPIIEVENLSAQFSGRRILNQVSFKAYPNQITVILGSSGCGKTTLLKHLIGLYKPQTGTVRVLDTLLNNADEKTYEDMARQMGVLFQNGALLNSMTVAENIAVPLEQNTKLPAPVIEYLIRMKLQLVELGEAYGLYPAQLSGGMRKRVALARALALDSPLLFCDEPSAGLDPVTLTALDRLFLKLKNDLEMTVVLVTHEVPSIFRLADRILFLDRGEAIFTGSLKEAGQAHIPQIDRFFKEGSAARRE